MLTKTHNRQMARSKQAMIGKTFVGMCKGFDISIDRENSDKLNITVAFTEKQGVDANSLSFEELAATVADALEKAAKINTRKSVGYIWDKLDLTIRDVVTQSASGSRIANCLESEGVVYVGQLIERHCTKKDLLKIPNFGEKSLKDLKDILHNMGLDMSMSLDSLKGWKPPMER